MKSIDPEATPGTKLAAITTVALAATFAVLTLTSIPQLAGVGISDKLAHLLASAAIAAPLSTVRARYSPFIFIGVCAYGAGIELLQPLVGRDGDWGDLAADAVGAFAGAAGGAALGRLWRLNRA